MDFQTRKLHLISYLAQVQDESILDKIESLILKRETEDNDSVAKLFDVNEFVDRIKKSEQDLKNGNYRPQEDLEKLSENW